MKIKILILASNPRKDLNIEPEIRDLREVIEASRDRQQFEVEDALAVRVGDLQNLLFKYKPQIVHFCGHGSGQQGLVFAGKDGEEQWVRAEALAGLFKLFSADIGCVLLNACYSEVQADAIVNHIDYVIGMNQEIRDDAAIAFSKGFYRALGYGCSIEQAYEFGKNAIQLEISGSSKMRSVATEEGVRKAKVVDAIQHTTIPEHSKPILKCNPTLTQASNRVVSGSEKTLSQAKREEIQLDVAKVLTEEEPSLISERGINYTRLRELLRLGLWKEADQETMKTMIEAASRGQKGWLRVEDFVRFPCHDLCIIDRLWIEHSNKRLGLSAQRKIWDSVKLSSDRVDIIRDFCRACGSAEKRIGGRWIGDRILSTEKIYKRMDELTSTGTSQISEDVPVGFLPAVVHWEWLENGKQQSCLTALFSRLEDCKI